MSWAGVKFLNSPATGGNSFSRFQNQNHSYSKVEECALGDEQERSQETSLQGNVLYTMKRNSCTIHAQFMKYSSTVHEQFLCVTGCSSKRLEVIYLTHRKQLKHNSCTVQAQFMHSSNTIHAQFMHS